MTREEREIADGTIIILIIGGAGEGKSTLANALTNSSHFEVSSASTFIKENLQTQEFELSGKNFLVVDTPTFSQNLEKS